MSGLKRKQDTITEYQNTLLSRVNTFQAFFDRIIFRMYQDAQKKRWITQGASENIPWPNLNPDYKRSKAKRFNAYPGGGTKMMIATDALRTATIDKPYKIATNHGLKVSVNPSIVNPESKQRVSDYGKYVADERPFMEFSQQTIDQMRKKISQYIKSGVK